ncbi:hypothetical protein NDU88_000976 [Pleurodeles waltl]|uniref:Uncharacterized protein n=1 Tax=Pleurodeles waltl TaxID=8319 RepID=A0AAV7LW98_PLEWA|nr:hypothetical protein NDU88_000976 [Pleurodeles waltl]
MLRRSPSPRGSALRSTAPDPFTASPIRDGHPRGSVAQPQPRRGGSISAAILILRPIGSQRAPEAYSPPPLVIAGSPRIRELAGTVGGTQPSRQTAVSSGG